MKKWSQKRKIKNKNKTKNQRRVAKPVGVRSEIHIRFRCDSQTHYSSTALKATTIELHLKCLSMG